MTCPACGAAVPEGARFCPICGHQLTAPADERRVVTVLFADLVGFTGLSELRDPEHVKNLVDASFERLAADVTAYGGRVDNIVGDAMVALFGAPVAHEDDAERAVRAALRMQTTVAANAARLGAEIRLRVGVNTGEVLVGALRGGGDYTAMGDVVNVASRLETLAQPGQIVVGPHTWLATREVIGYERLGPVAVRGRDEAVEAWLALEATAPPGVRARDHLAPLVGRDSELGMLCDALRLSVTHRRRQLMLLVGEAGMGKSRLAREAAAAAASEHGALVIEGHCVPYGEASAWWPVAEIVRQLCGIALKDPADSARKKCRATIEESFPAATEEERSRLVDGLLWLMGVEGVMRNIEAPRAKDEAFRSLRVVLEGIAEGRPVVVVVSDLQWADGVVLNAFDHFLTRPARLPLIVIGTARPDFEGQWQIGSPLRNAVVLNLDPLPAEHAGALLDALLGTEVSADDRAMILARSGGNPFFLEELARLLKESGLLAEDRSAVPGSEQLLALPVTLRGIVAARLDALSADERSVLEDAAVLGRRGPVEALEALADQRGHHGVRALVNDLAARDLLVLDGDTIRFKSDLVREVAYGTLTKAERARRHARLAEWLEKEAGGDRDEEHLEELARHWATAAEIVAELGAVERVPEDIRPRALEAIGRAAERADEQESHKVTDRLYTSALRLLGDDADEPDGRRRAFLIGRAKARTALREPVPARADLDAAFEEASAAGDRLAEGRAMTVLGELQRNEGDYVSSEATLQHAVDLLRELGDRKSEAAALRRLGFTRMWAGRHDEAEETVTEALEAFRELGVRKGEAWALQNLAWIAFSRGDQQLAEERIQASTTMFREIGDRGGLAWALGLQAWVWYFRGRTAEAASLAERVLQEARDLGDRWPMGILQVLLASIRLWEGRTDEALQKASEARDIFVQINDSYGRSMAVGVLARARLAAGQIAEVDELLHEERDLIKGKGAPDDFGATVAANMAAQIGDGERALQELGVLREDASLNPRLATAERGVIVALALLQTGRAEEAAIAAEEAVAHLDDPGPRAFGLAALVLTRAAIGDRNGAEAAARDLAGLGAGTYLDRFTATVGCALAAAREQDGAAARGHVSAATAEVEPTGDEIAHALAVLARGWVERALGTRESAPLLAEARERLTGMGVHAAGWDTAFRLAAIPA